MKYIFAVLISVMVLGCAATQEGITSVRLFPADLEFQHKASVGNPMITILYTITKPRSPYEQTYGTVHLQDVYSYHSFVDGVLMITADEQVKNSPLNYYRYSLKNLPDTIAIQDLRIAIHSVDNQSIVYRILNDGGIDRINRRIKQQYQLPQ